MALIGDSRVSTDGQSLTAQDSALREVGCTKIFAEKASGAKTDRKALAKAIADLFKLRQCFIKRGLCCRQQAIAIDVLCLMR